MGLTTIDGLLFDKLTALNTLYVRMLCTEIAWDDVVFSVVCSHLDSNLPSTNELPTGLFASTPLLHTLVLSNMGLITFDPQLLDGLTALQTLYEAPCRVYIHACVCRVYGHILN